MSEFEGDLDVPLVSIECDNFKATVPWTAAMSGQSYMMMAMSDDSAIQIAVAMKEFMEMLSTDKLDEFGALDMADTVAVITQWFEKSTVLMKATGKWH